MKRKANPVETAPLPTCAAVGPDDMVLVACPSGETFLIERNCALLSAHCRDTLLGWESAIRRAVSQNRNDQSTTTAAVGSGLTPVDAVTVGFPSSSGGIETGSWGFSERTGGVRVLGASCDTASMTIPFMPAWDDDNVGVSVASLEAQVQHVPLTTIAERYQRRLDEVTPTKVARPSSSKVPSSHGDRKGMMVVPKPISPLAPLEDDKGRLLYPVVQLYYATPPLLEASLLYVAKKYKVDMDGDKVTAESVPPVSAIATGERWQMIAAAVLTGV
jgi:hypothetical protein